MSSISPLLNPNLSDGTGNLANHHLGLERSCGILRIYCFDFKHSVIFCLYWNLPLVNLCQEKQNHVGNKQLEQVY